MTFYKTNTSSCSSFHYTAQELVFLLVSQGFLSISGSRVCRSPSFPILCPRHQTFPAQYPTKNHADVHKTLRYINGNCSTNLVFRWFARLRLRCVVLADFIFVLSYLLVQVRRLRSCSTRFGFLTSFLHKQFNAMPHLLQAEYQFVQCLRAPSRLASRISPLCACSF